MINVFYPFNIAIIYQFIILAVILAIETVSLYVVSKNE